VSDAPARHIPALLEPIVTWLAPVIQTLWVDCTIGLAGHARALFVAVPPVARLMALDVDPGSIERARAELEEYRDRVQFVQGNFGRLDDHLTAAGSGPVDAILADLGVNSLQYERHELGLSFEREAPLDMRLDPTLGVSAADLVNRLSEKELSDLLYLESQEHHSRKIARRICQARRAARITSTAQLARLAASAVGGRRGRLHPATKTFMALRAAVNHEAEALQGLLEASARWLRPGGRLAIISFHSGEDRRVKHDFRERARRGEYRLLTKHPLTPDAAEVAANPRSRSAKLRIAERS